MWRFFSQNRRLLLLYVLPGAILISLLVFYLLTGRYQSTDDAYVQAATVSVSSYVSGHVQAIYVKDNQYVKKGQPLFSLDPKPFSIALADANAKLVNARLQIQSLKANYQQQLARVAAAKDTLSYETKEYARQKKLYEAHIASQSELNAWFNRYQNAVNALAAEKQQLANILASLANNPGISTDAHPLVQQAIAGLNQAKLQASYVTTYASINGFVGKVPQLQVGDFIKTGEPVFSLVSNQTVWVEANYKETQLTYMRPGQTATIEIDSYPDQTFSGHVESTSPGTGASFSLLPPENATGNWVKIVQRVPVRIMIDHANFKQPMVVGLSATVTVDTQHRYLS